MSCNYLQKNGQPNLIAAKLIKTEKEMFAKL